MSLTIAELQVRLDHLEKASHTPYFYYLTHRVLTAAWSCGQLPGFSQEDVLNIAGAARLHDLGKLSVPEVILDKTGSLTVEETSLMENHAEYGKQVLDALFPLGPSCPPLIQYAREICLHHHERWSGAGYLDHLHGEEIPRYVQVVSLADCYDALRTCRGYRPAVSHESAKYMILSGSCGGFDPRLLALFQQVIDDITADLYQGDVCHG